MDTVSSYRYPTVVVSAEPRLLTIRNDCISVDDFPSKQILVVAHTFFEN